MKSKIARRSLLIVSLSVAAALFAACQPAAPLVDEATQPGVETVTEQPQADDEQQEAPTTEPAATATEQEGSAAADSQPTEAESNEQAAPTARIGLVATNPQDVELASGEVQLIEFFAFW